MITPDANLLLYAYDGTSPFHDKARAWWSACLSGNEPVGLTHPALFAFLRISTSARVFDHPMTLEEAVGHIDAWLARDVALVLLPDEEYVKQTIRLLEAAGNAGGNLVTDAQIAALAMSYKAEIHTADRDFLRFPGLSCHFPLDA